jgi:exonuclease SbcC
VKLDKVSAQNFQGLETAELELADLTLIWGLNGSGKSSILDAIAWAVTGEAPRGGPAVDVLRQGSRGSAEVEAVFGGRSVIRRRSKTTGSVWIDGVETRAADADRAIEALLGAPLSAVSAALRSGALLDLPSDELQALIGGLTGASAGAEAIAAALGAEVADAARRAGLRLPAALKAFDVAATRAEEARRQAKRELAEREADLARLPTPASSPAPKERVESVLADLRARRAAEERSTGRSAGALEERRRALRSEAERLAQVAAPTEAPTDVESLAVQGAQAIAELARLGGELGAEERRLAELERDADGYQVEDAVLAGRAHGLEEKIGAAQKVRADADATLHALAVEGRSRKTLLERLPVGTVGPCPVLPETTCPVSDLTALAERLRAARDEVAGRYKAAAIALREADAEVARLRSESEASFSAQRRVEAHAAVEAARARVEDLRRRADEAAAAVKPIEAELRRAKIVAESAKAWTASQERLAAIRAELAQLATTAPAEPVDLAAIDAEIVRAESALEDWRRSEAREANAWKVKGAAARVADADAVAQACGPSGARSEIIAKAAGPFLDAANASLAQVAPSLRLELSAEMELEALRGAARLRPAQLSDGERMRLLWSLQVAVARLAKFPLVLVDRAELLDEGGKGALKRFAAGIAREGMQVVMVSCAAPPATLPAGVAGYVVEAGQVRSVGAAKAA